MSPPPRGQFQSTVLTNQPLCREHWRLVLGLPHFPPTHPGQFIQVACRDLGKDFDGQSPEPMALLRRPFSLAGRQDTKQSVELEVIHRVVGVGTRWLSNLRVGDVVDILGPLGNSFALPGEGYTALLVGGGVGIPPMLYLAQQFSGQAAVAFAGAVTRDLLPLTIHDGKAQEFAHHAIDTVITTDDGSYGLRGLVTEALERYLDSNPGRYLIYTCGPEAMMKRVTDISIQRHIPCQVAVERSMACGMGTCQSCVIRVRQGQAWVYKLACTDGPTFTAEELLW